MSIEGTIRHAEARGKALSREKASQSTSHASVATSKTAKQEEQELYMYPVASICTRDRAHQRS
ncbi:hypothetical protein COCSUDRAFT_32230 [Coccomyxa subellipsoidea C-169]|uniref:Uncharacterized protein n=1 Tax=Coccomyxa subellipsoidea (strain C-169) TaxID=574566 RepID=I0Z7K4_COCSC|nr:hypothetical protein COCSUDRAFT_32230 [Coccomyxa subellipsoidea C-169]EIE26623.1 hypothetical protein COCSUDRAFT_32230 [Coccomyxa subellipsoidea C-169]|eukprot:XP_005651167.1 hypothetical protein COCSUDRAFT_32230 [Coccomyxa subellipsoidea C-169]